MPTRFILLLAALLATPALAQAPVPAAVQSPARPAEDVAQDAARKPAEMLEFARVGPGTQVADMIAGGGYFTRLFAVAAGPTGKVVAIVPPTSAKLDPKSAEIVGNLPKNPAFANVTVEQALPTSPGSFDVIWTSMNYHDLHNFLSPEAVLTFNKAVLDALKPGGVYVIVDHAAAPGSGTTATRTLHRIDPAVVKAEVQAAGFVEDGETNVLANPADDHSRIVFDPAIRGQTDRFAYRFRKP
jgi:predicted methyltransferase